jgi:hypothetical protein
LQSRQFWGGGLQPIERVFELMVETSRADKHAQELADSQAVAYNQQQEPQLPQQQQQQLELKIRSVNSSISTSTVSTTTPCAFSATNDIGATTPSAPLLWSRDSCERIKHLLEEQMLDTHARRIPMLWLFYIR